MTQLSRLVNMEKPQCILDEVKVIVSMMAPDFDFKPFDEAYVDVMRLFQGDYPGYRECNTLYHDLRHTMAVLLAMTRLIHGYQVAKKERFTERELNIGLISALMHDTGYHQTIDDTTGTGAKHTLVHVQRSIDFLSHYFEYNEYFKNDLSLFRDVLNCTGLKNEISDIRFDTKKNELLGLMLGTADLLGQMADRHYLEKLIFLFHEFQEANIGTFNSELDLLQRTIHFYEMTRKRFTAELGDVNRYMIFHFKERWRIDEDLYAAGIEKNIRYLNFVLKTDEVEYRQHLRRAGLIEKLDKKLKEKQKDKKGKGDEKPDR